MTIAASTSRPRVVVLDDYQDAARQFGPWDRLSDRVELDPVPAHFDDLDALAQRIGDATVLVMMRERTTVGADLLDRLPQLGLIVTTGPSNAVLDVAAAVQRGITVCGTGGYVGPTTELTWALILAAVRHIPAEHHAIQQGGWQHTVGMELAGRRLGVVGLGRIGTAVARVGQAFDMEVVAWSQNLDPQMARDRGINPVSKEELFATSDVVSLHLVLSERTRGLVGAGDLAAMKPTAIFVNTSRGPLVDEPALIAALQAGTIAAAGLDVFSKEPLPVDHPLRHAPRTVLTPHIGYVTDGLYRLFFSEIIDDIEHWLGGHPVRVIGAPASA